MAKYLVECTCGKNVPVEIGQAGGRVTCSCGNLVDVPPLRQLRHLAVDTTAEVARPASTWSARKGVITASLILAGALVIANAWSRFTQPAIPKFDAAGYQQDIEARLTKLNPSDAFNIWIGHYRPMGEHGFYSLELYNRGAIEQNIAERQSLRQTLWIVAAIAGAIALAAAFWPKSPDLTSRRID
jgi:hypothetical protein